MKKLLVRLLAGVVLVVAALAIGGWLTLRASLPALDGSVAVAGVSGAVTIERDGYGAAKITGATRPDVAFGLGYAHGQDRFFQMDLMRRAAAGELSALLGKGTLETDRKLRVHRFRSVARAAVAAATPEQRAVAEAYTAGVNAGRRSLRARPFEYLVLQAEPEDWRPEDSILVSLAMFLQLQQPDGQAEIQRGLIRDALPESAARFVYAAATDWEAALDGSHLDAPVIPGLLDYDLRQVASPDLEDPDRRPRARSGIGSNNWAIAGRRTSTGAALVANDMHLGLRVPNTWYHARLVVTAPGDGAMDVTGVTLPGTPVVVTGSNTHVAWAFTNSYGDYEDVIIAVPDPAEAGHYLTAAGSKAFTHANERILVKGGTAEELEVVGTEWGPVIGHDDAGRGRVLEWTAHDPAAVNLNIMDVEHARTIDEAMAVAARAGIPAQNFVSGDAAGHVAWTIAGQIPTRRGGDATVPRLSTDPDIGFTGWVQGEDRPRIVDPVTGQIATANARVVGGTAQQVIGDGGYDRGARAGQIAANLAARGDHLTPADALAVQLDDRSLFLARWKDLLATLLDDDAVRGQPRRAELRQVLGTWSGHAAVDDAAYRLVRAFRMELEQRTFHALIAPARVKSPSFRFRVPASFEGPLWALVRERPAHLLPPGHSDWRAFLLATVDATLASLAAECPKLAECTWGRANRVWIRHPLSQALPALSALIDIPAESLPGDEDMPRFQAPAAGASERFAVSPGHEAEAYFEMPGGQSGHPLSAYFRAGHDAWAHGTRTPFLPGPAEHTLTLHP